MRLVKIYVCLFALSVLALQPVWSGAKYIVPILPFILIWLVGYSRGSCGENSNHYSRVYLYALLTIFFLSNAVWLGTRAVKQVGDNIQYIRGNRYAGYPPEVRKMFEAFERARGLPDSAVLVCRKPEILYIVSGRQSIYPWEIE